MSNAKPVTVIQPQLALQSYLDGLLQEAAAELDISVSLDEFEAAVREELQRDETALKPVLAVVEPQLSSPAPAPVVAPIETAFNLAAAAPPNTPVVSDDGRPDWASAPFECLLFDVAGLSLAVPLVSLGSIYPLNAKELTPIFGQPSWFLGIVPSQAGNLKVLDTARWVMPDRYRDDLREGLQYVISVQGYEWGLAVHQVNRSIRLHPDDVKWRTQRTQRPWLAGTVIEQMCALLDVTALAELIANGAATR